jgi:hypothetical protein
MPSSRSQLSKVEPMFFFFMLLFPSCVWVS